MESWRVAPEAETSLVRFCSLTAVLVVFASRGVWLYEAPDALDPLGLRFGLAALFAAVLGATFLPARLRRLARPMYLAVCILAAVWIAWLCHLNRFDSFTTVGLMLVSMSVGCTLPTYSHFFVFQGTIITVAAAAAAITPQPTVRPGFVFLGLLTVTISELIALHAHRRTQDTSRKSESLMGTVFDEAADGLVVMEPSGRVIRANERILRMLGVGEPGDVQQRLQLPQAEQAGPTSFSDRLELSTVDRDGTQMWVDVVFRYLHDDVRPLWLVRMSDITARKEMEEANERARDDAERSNRAKARFLATMSHEIRTPMNGVIGMASLLKETDLDPEQTSFVDTLEKSGQTLLSIVNEILDFSKIEAGRIELETTEGKPRDVVYDVLELLSASASEKNLELVGDVDPDVPAVVSCDVTRLQQVLTNLVGNAVKFTSHGQVRVHVQADLPGGGKAILRFSVEDTGPGISPDRENRLFRTFSQMDAAHTRQYGGSGLGLAISKRLVELMGGSIEVRSQEGRGSTLSFTARVDIVSTDNADCVVLEPLRGRTALIAVENEGLAVSLRRSLETWGLEVLHAHGADEVHEELARRPAVDVVVIEDGAAWTAGTAVFQAPAVENGYTAVLVLTGLSRRRLLEAQGAVSAAIHKPVRPRDLRRTLIALVGHESPVTDVTDRPHRVSHNLDGVRVLLAEDNRVSRRVAEQMLARLGCEVQSVTNGLEAIQALRDGTFHIVLMDVQMPEMDGLTATRSLRRRYDRETLPILAMTASATIEDRQRCLEAGMNDHLAKPIRLADLRGALIKLTQETALDTSTG